jgi:hypothetical protein
VGVGMGKKRIPFGVAIIFQYFPALFGKYSAFVVY